MGKHITRFHGSHRGRGRATGDCALVCGFPEGSPLGKLDTDKTETGEREAWSRLCVHACVCAHARVCMCARACAYVCVHTCVHVCTSVCACGVCGVCMCAQVCARMCAHACMHVCARACVCMCVCARVCAGLGGCESKSFQCRRRQGPGGCRNPRETVGRTYLPPMHQLLWDTADVGMPHSPAVTSRGDPQGSP